MVRTRLTVMPASVKKVWARCQKAVALSRVSSDSMTMAEGGIDGRCGWPADQPSDHGVPQGDQPDKLVRVPLSRPEGLPRLPDDSETATKTTRKQGKWTATAPFHLWPP